MPDKPISPEEQLRRIVYLARQLDGDVRAYGPHLPQMVGEPSVHEYLAKAYDLLTEALVTTRLGRDDYVNAQMQRLGLDQNSRDLKVELGGGRQSYPPGWLNVDLHPAHLALNAAWGLPFADESVQYLYCCHVLEHLYHGPGNENSLLIKEIYRVMQPGGVVRLIVPDIGLLLDAYNRNDEAFFKNRAATWDWAENCSTHLEHILGYAGANHMGVSFEGHRYGYDFETLALCLRDAGFTKITRSSFMGSFYPELNLDSASPNARAASGDVHYSLFVDVMK